MGSGHQEAVWQRGGAVTCAGACFGFPANTPRAAAGAWSAKSVIVGLFFHQFALCSLLNPTHQVLSCMAASVPLAGLSDSQPGIPEVRTLILEFQKCLAGGGPPGETSESAAAGDAPAASAGTEAADDPMEFAVGCALEEVDPQHAAAQEPAGKIRKGDF